MGIEGSEVKKKLFNTSGFTVGTYFLLVLAILMIGFIFLQNNKTLNHIVTSFFEVAENRTFDYRQAIRVVHKKPVPNKDIVILAIDDASLEVLWEKYGEWPIPRSVYADMVNYIEKDKPQNIIFDLMFLKSIRSSLASDKALTEAMNKYNNIYTAMNFDGVSSGIRRPPELPSRMEVFLDNPSNVDFRRRYAFQNCRAILPELLEGNVKVGMTNVVRNSDGIIRRISPILTYKGRFYPYLSFQAASEYIKSTDIKLYFIDADGTLNVDDTKIPLNKYGEATLNWYGPSGTHTIYPMYKLIQDMEGNVNDSDRMNFKDKIVIVGTTAMSLHDTKSVPVQEGVYPGVEVHATFFNNMLDNNFIRQTGINTNIWITFALIIITSTIVMLSNSVVFAVLSSTLFGIAYMLLSYYLMDLYNLWIPVAVPIILIVLTFAVSFLVKYLIKSRDFEYQYKLATVDGLTELYNHRFFQDSLRSQLEMSKRYENKFSLIIIDIDFFKKFNDNYGHQAGDAVLRQVAQTLKKNSRTTDIVCRYGGEEMSIILPNTSADEALFHAQRINKAVSERDFQISATQTSKVTISVGVATFPENGDTPQTLIEWADKGLYYAKEHGRNQVGVWSEQYNNDNN